MGICQDQFQNVPDTLEQLIHEERYTHHSIRQSHKNVRPNSQEVSIGIFSKSNQQYLIDREQFYQTVRPFKQPSTITLSPSQSQVISDYHHERQELNLDFYYSLALPEYSFEPIPSLYASEFADVQVYDQEDKNGVKYIGEWKNNTIHGNGIMKSNTAKYIGQFRNGLKHFHGRQIQKYQVYQGQFSNGRRKGQGTRYTPEQQESGIFDDHLVEGTINYSNGDVYEGTLKNNKFHGFGKLVTSNITYEGEFVKGKMEGKATVRYSDGKFYEGFVKDNEKSGEGYFEWNNRNHYKGEYLRGKKHGKGVLMRDGTIYDGHFKNGVMHGKMSIYQQMGSERINCRVQQYVEGVRIHDNEDSISDSLPSDWKAAICS